MDHTTGCTSCSDVCYEDCICSCRSACGCLENRTNMPFQEDEKVKVVKTQHCGWGVEEDEFIDKGDYIIEYVGEVINDALCEKRFWDMKGKCITNFYIVVVREDLNIDAKFKGNESRFINHSCDPNCVMEKWDINGEEEFKIDPKWKRKVSKKLETPPYVHIKRNIYRVKKKGYDVDHNTGCASCSDICYEDCLCRSVHISCTSACACSESCTNRQFDQEDKKVKVVKTQHCGWGVVADEFIDKGDYIIEYVGEAIDDALCEKRFWDMKGKRITNFYVVAVRKDLNIDAQYKGNESRFINHSCDPNCIMEKWDVNGETHLGIFAAKEIEPKEELTFDYGYEMYGRDKIKCHCGALNCRGYLGAKRPTAGAATN